MSNLSMRSLKDYWLIIICFVLCSVSLVIVIPGVQTVFKEQKLIEDRTQLRDTYDKKIKILTNQNPTELKKDLTNSLLALPSSYDTPSLLNALEKLADTSGMSFQGLQFSQSVSAGGSANQTPTPSTTAIKNTFSLSTSADFSRIMAMLKNFENTLPLFSIENIDLRVGGESGEDLSLSFGVSTYYQALPSSLGEKSTPLTELTEAQKALLTELEGYSNYPLIPDTSGVGKTNPFE